MVSGGGEGAHNLPIGRRAGGDVEGVDVDFNLAVDAAGNGGNDLADAAKDAYICPSGCGGTTRDGAR